MTENAFTQWLDTFIEEKGLDLEYEFEVEGKEWGTNFIPLGALVEVIKSAPTMEQKAIKDMIVRIDFSNGDVMDYFKHLCKAIAL